MVRSPGFQHIQRRTGEQAHPVLARAQSVIVLQHGAVTLLIFYLGSSLAINLRWQHENFVTQMRAARPRIAERTRTHVARTMGLPLCA